MGVYACLELPLQFYALVPPILTLEINLFEIIYYTSQNPVLKCSVHLPRCQIIIIYPNKWIMVSHQILTVPWSWANRPESLRVGKCRMTRCSLSLGKVPLAFDTFAVKMSSLQLCICLCLVPGHLDRCLEWRPERSGFWAWQSPFTSSSPSSWELCSPLLQSMEEVPWEGHPSLAIWIYVSS